MICIDSSNAELVCSMSHDVEDCTRERGCVWIKGECKQRAWGAGCWWGPWRVAWRVARVEATHCRRPAPSSACAAWTEYNMCRHVDQHLPCHGLDRPTLCKEQ